MKLSLLLVGAYGFFMLHVVASSYSSSYCGSIEVFIAPSGKKCSDYATTAKPPGYLKISYLDTKSWDRFNTYTSSTKLDCGKKSKTQTITVCFRKAGNLSFRSFKAPGATTKKATSKGTAKNVSTGKSYTYKVKCKGKDYVKYSLGRKASQCKSTAPVSPTPTPAVAKPTPTTPTPATTPTQTPYPTTTTPTPTTPSPAPTTVTPTPTTTAPAPVPATPTPSPVDDLLLGCPSNGFLSTDGFWCCNKEKCTTGTCFSGGNGECVGKTNDPCCGTLLDFDQDTPPDFCALSNSAPCTLLLTCPETPISTRMLANANEEREKERVRENERVTDSADGYSRQLASIGACNSGSTQSCVQRCGTKYSQVTASGNCCAGLTPKDTTKTVTVGSTQIKCTIWTCI